MAAIIRQEVGTERGGGAREWEGEEGRKAESKVENGSRGKGGKERGVGGEGGEKVNAMKRRQKTERKAALE